jgi:hypothetical protein
MAMIGLQVRPQKPGAGNVHTRLWRCVFLYCDSRPVVLAALQLGRRPGHVLSKLWLLSGGQQELY